jgi:hypothetical protein
MGGMEHPPPNPGHVDLSMTRYVVQALRAAGVPTEDPAFAHARIFMSSGARTTIPHYPKDCRWRLLLFHYRIRYQQSRAGWPTFSQLRHYDGGRHSGASGNRRDPPGPAHPRGTQLVDLAPSRYGCPWIRRSGVSALAERAGVLLRSIGHGGFPRAGDAHGSFGSECAKTNPTAGWKLGESGESGEGRRSVDCDGSCGAGAGESVSGLGINIQHRAEPIS